MVSEHAPETESALVVGRHDAYLDMHEEAREFRIVFPWLTGRCETPSIPVGRTQADALDALSVARKIAWDTRTELELFRWVRQYVLMRDRARHEERPAS